MEYDTRIDRGTIAEFADRLEVHSRYADLLIIGQPDQSAREPTAPEPGDVALSAAAPILVIPFIGLREGFGKRPMIAWNASREAARAVKNAMSFLEWADAVDVVTFRPREGRDTHGELPSADIALHLWRGMVSRSTFNAWTATTSTSGTRCYPTLPITTATFWSWAATATRRRHADHLALDDPAGRDGSLMARPT